MQLPLALARTELLRALSNVLGRGLYGQAWARVLELALACSLTLLGSGGLSGQ